MAYFIFSNENNLIKIALNDADKNCLNEDLSLCNVQSVSESDAESIIFNQKTLSFDGTTVTLTPIDYTLALNDPDNPNASNSNYDPEVNLLNADDLQSYINNFVKPLLKIFIENNPNNGMYDAINNYLEYLNNLDYSIITYPINFCWEKYCKDNNISFFHPLQIP